MNPRSHTSWPGNTTRVLVVGDVMCDTYLSGHVSRISPEAPVPVFESTEKRHVLGGAANVAANLRALSCRGTPVGGDGRRRRRDGYVREHVRAQGMADDLLLRDAGRPHHTRRRGLIARRQQLVRLDQESRLPLPPELDRPGLCRASSPSWPTWTVSCAPITTRGCARRICWFRCSRWPGAPACRSSSTPRRGDFRPLPRRYRADAQPGRGPAGDGRLSRKTIAASPRPPVPCCGAARRRRFWSRAGEAGMSLFHPPEAPRHIPAHTRDVYDVTGAGGYRHRRLLRGRRPSTACPTARRRAGPTWRRASSSARQVPRVVHPEGELEAQEAARDAPWQRKVANSRRVGAGAPAASPAERAHRLHQRAASTSCTAATSTTSSRRGRWGTASSWR